MAVNGRRKARAARRRKRRMDRVAHDLSDEQWTALIVAWGGCAYCGRDRDAAADATACWRSLVVGATRSTTSCRPAAPATPASATTRSRAGYGESGSTSARSSCVTWRSTPRSPRGSTTQSRDTFQRSGGTTGSVGHGAEASSEAARRTSIDSSPRRAANCTPTGRPLRVGARRDAHRRVAGGVEDAGERAERRRRAPWSRAGSCRPTRARGHRSASSGVSNTSCASKNGATSRLGASS